MAPKPELYLYDGKYLSAKELADIRGCEPDNMRFLIRTHGYPKAMTVKTRKVKRGERGKIKDASEVKLKPYDKFLENKRRCMQWLRQGMSIDEIKIKVRMI